MSWKILVFLLAFQINVKVRANFMDQPMGEPAQCWQKQEGSCSVQAGKKPLVLKTEILEMWAEGDSFLERESTGWKLLKGSVRGQNEKPASLGFPFGEVKSESGEFWIIDSGSRFLIRAVSESLRIHTKDGRILELPEGLEVWVGPQSLQGSFTHGVPALIPVDDHLRRWNQLNDLSKEEFIRQAQLLKMKWKDRQVVASALYEKVAERHIASAAEEEATVRRRQEKENAQRERFRKLLYHKAFER
ncbi:MAG: hypothetical protein KF789_05935 [Bdellovibrionaceae bacterium]|nr:hypothetical protein [Pseudobdellovibrionaceae bacterium]